MGSEGSVGSIRSAGSGQSSEGTNGHSTGLLIENAQVGGAGGGRWLGPGPGPPHPLPVPQVRVSSFPVSSHCPLLERTRCCRDCTPCPWQVGRETGTWVG